jgi:hypothetical protein
MYIPVLHTAEVGVHITASAVNPEMIMSEEKKKIYSLVKNVHMSKVF